MISFWVSVVPPEIDCVWLSPGWVLGMRVQDGLLGGHVRADRIAQLAVGALVQADPVAADAGSGLGWPSGKTRTVRSDMSSRFLPCR